MGWADLRRRQTRLNTLCDRVRQKRIVSCGRLALPLPAVWSGPHGIRTRTLPVDNRLLAS
jgi:hypothetical protein